MRVRTYVSLTLVRIPRNLFHRISFRTQTECDGGKFPSDILLKKLIDLFNMDNPPCANCDKRDRTSMYFCSTCSKNYLNFIFLRCTFLLLSRQIKYAILSTYWVCIALKWLEDWCMRSNFESCWPRVSDQALCRICRENTHRAKMFSSHDVLPMNKFTQEGQKKVYI